jgi:multiple sugar transport system permease protein
LLRPTAWTATHVCSAAAVLGLLGTAAAFVLASAVPAILLAFGTLTALYCLLLILVPDRLVGRLLLVPSLLALVATTGVPIGYMLITSVYDVGLTTFQHTWRFVGLANYADLFWRDPQLWPTLWRTVEYLVFGLGLQIGLGLGLALLLNREFPGKRLAQTVLVFPILTTPVVVAMLWKYLFDVQTGLINQVLGLVGIEPRPWLSVGALPGISAIPWVGTWLADAGNFTYGFWAIILVTVWQWAPFCFLVLYAGLVSLPQEPYEAARMDGASGWQVFRYLTLPLLLPLILTVTLLRLIDLLKVYAQIWVLFGNLVNTRVLNIHLYTLGLGTHEYSKASALGVLTLLAVMLFTWLLLPWIQGERVRR